MSKSTESGAPAVKNANFEVLIPFNMQSIRGGMSHVATPTQIIELMGFPHKSIVHVEFSQIQVIPETQPSADAYMILYLIPADSDETTVTFAQASVRLIDAEMMSIIFGDGTGMVILPGQKFQTWIDEIFWNDRLSWAGLYLYMFTSADPGCDFTIRIKVQGTIFLTQRYFLDNYTRKGRRITEGWEGYEWEESISDDDIN